MSVVFPDRTTCRETFPPSSTLNDHTLIRFLLNLFIYRINCEFLREWKPKHKVSKCLMEFENFIRFFIQVIWDQVCYGSLESICLFPNLKRNNGIRTMGIFAVGGRNE